MNVAVDLRWRQRIAWVHRSVYQCSIRQHLPPTAHPVEQCADDITYW